jgi:diguanylate cyclase (GGDEF)-like protein
MDLERFGKSLEDISHLLSHLHGEIANLESHYSKALLVLRQLKTDAGTDELTGVLRRGAFFERLQKLVGECTLAREGFGILLIDLDHFKRINDTHGHLTGDEVLSRIGKLLKKFETPHCFSGRFGGEEFIVAQRGTDAELLMTAEMIRRNAEQLSGRSLVGDWKCTVSIGVATARLNGTDVGSQNDVPRLLKDADDALYEAKRKGRNQVKVA